MKQKDIFNFKSKNSHSFSIFTSCVTWKRNVGTLTHSKQHESSTKNYCSFFYVKQYFRVKKGRRQKLINIVLVSFEMRKYASCAEMNMVLKTITNAQLLPFDSSNTYLRNFVTFIYWKALLLLKHFSSL